MCRRGKGDGGEDGEEGLLEGGEMGERMWNASEGVPYSWTVVTEGWARAYENCNCQLRSGNTML